MSALRAFVSDLLDAEGAIVEASGPDRLDVLAPEPLRSKFGWREELVRLEFGSAATPGTQRVGLDSDWLERFANLLGDRGRSAQRQLPRHPIAPPGSPERLIERALELPNAVWRYGGQTETWTQVLLLAFRYAALSDEKRDGLVWLGFNLGTGAVLRDDLVLRLVRHATETSVWLAPESENLAMAGQDMLSAEQLATRIPALLERRVHDELATFLRSMQRRLDRDRARVFAYHNDLRQAAIAKVSKLRASSSEKAAAETQREMLKADAIKREYAAKIEDLRHKYALQVEAECVQSLVLLAPVQRHSIVIKRRKGERTVAMDWHPAVRQMETPLDEVGLGLDAVRLVCDDSLHLTSASAQTCASCGKARCQACHPAQCPKCERR